MEKSQVSAVILAGGTGTRLRPLTSVVNKHLLPVGRYPMIFHPLAKLIQMGVEDVNVVTGPDTVGRMAELLSSGDNWGINLSYAVQHQPGGNAEALARAERLVESDYLVVIQGDNIFTEDLSGRLEKFLNSGENANFFLKEVPDPERFGVPRLVDGEIEAVLEKPSSPPTNYCVTGIYFYDAVVFDLIERVSRRENGELDLTDVNNLYLDEYKTRHYFLQNDWIDAGTFSSYQKANNLLADKKYPVFQK